MPEKVLKYTHDLWDSHKTHQAKKAEVHMNTARIELSNV